MKSKAPKNLAASMRAKLLDRARDRKEDFQFMLGRSVAERFLFRPGKSDQREAFVLKGATLFLIWQGKLLQPTRDIDLLGYGSAQIRHVLESIRAVCSIEVADGIAFDLAGVTGEEIREDAEYDGVRNGHRLPSTAQEFSSKSTSASAVCGRSRTGGNDAAGDAGNGISPA